jgi:hypothetical protein
VGVGMCGCACTRYSKLEYLIWVIHTNIRTK